ncbi:MAG: TraB/GumN family protein [Gammaproteobacteria bacterium]|nr:TraB/GumN family protein [Gammaproteobacteria bacterium]MDH3406851.1 TraB/GumN family protein [Gammaproteobacteria bacterium]MDH3563015.1 TraB/GumN family protein [Gammaproteobacteria bacterium]
MRRHFAIDPDISTAVRRYLVGILLSCFLILPLWTSAPHAALPATKSAADVTPETASRFTKGLLWKIESPNIPASYVFGTIHSDDKRVTALPEPVSRSLNDAKQFVMEAIVDGDALVSMAEVMFFNDDRTLEQVIGQKLYRDTKKALSARGMPTQGIEKQKPWAVMMALSMPTPKTGEYLDFVLQAHVTRMNKPVSGLESIAEQLSVFNDLSLSDQIALLEDTVRAQSTLDRQFEELHQAWLARDLGAIMALAEKYKPGDDRLYFDVMDRLLNQRNLRMVERMGPILKEGSAFIAVGAAHLPGETGLLYRLEKAGYRVRPVY